MAKKEFQCLKFDRTFLFFSTLFKLFSNKYSTLTITKQVERKVQSVKSEKGSWFSKHQLYIGHHIHFAALESNCEILNFVEIVPPSSWSGFASGSFRFLFSTNPTCRKWIETRQLAWSRKKITYVSTHLCYNRASKPWKAGFATGGRELKFTSNWSNRNGWS